MQKQVKRKTNRTKGSEAELFKKKKVQPLSVIKWLILQSWAGTKNWLTEGKRELQYKVKTEQSRGGKQLPQSLFSLGFPT